MSLAGGHLQLRFPLRAPWGCLPFVAERRPRRRRAGCPISTRGVARASLSSEACYAVVRLAARICEALQALSGVEPATEPSTGGLLAMYG